MTPAPEVFHFRETLSTTALDELRRIIEPALAEHELIGDIESPMDNVCASRRPVPVHTDGRPGLTEGMTICGLVLHNDGHVLRTMAAERACMGPIPLQAGDFYLIDIDDPHWTEVPDDDPGAVLIFTPYIMRLDKRRRRTLDGRSLKQLAHDMRFTVLADTIEQARIDIAAAGGSTHPTGGLSAGGSSRQGGATQ